MGRADIQTKEYMADPARFADAFNYLVYGGRQVVKKERLSPLDSTTVAAPYGAKGSTGVQRHRDGLKLWQAMRDGRRIYAVLGVENQTKTHYAMPVRNMLYDAMSFASQISGSRDAQGGHKAQARKGAEFLSGFGKDDRLLPVVTLVIHFGTKEWDGPLSLHEMLAEQDEELLALVPDYKINLIDPSRIREEDFQKFHTELGLVLGYIKHAGNKDELALYVENDERYRSVDAQSVRLINAITDSELKLAAGEEKVDMCQAIKDMRAESYESGRADERRRMSQELEGARAESYESGRAEGERTGERRGMLEALAGLVNDGILSLEEACVRAGLSAEDFSAEVANLA